MRVYTRRADAFADTRGAALAGDLQGLVDRDLPALQALGEVFALDELQGEEERAVDVSEGR